MILKAVLVDLDGVLLDTFRVGLRKIRLLCTLHEVPFGRDTRAKLFNAWGLPGIELMIQCLDISRTLAERMYKDWEKLDKDLPPELIPGAREVLFWLRRNKIKAALITSRHRLNLLEVLDGLDLLREFTIITSKEDSPYHKPDPRVFRFALEHLQEHTIEKENCIFVGDTPSDTKAGKEAGLETLVVQTGPYMIEHIETFPVKLSNVLRSIDDLPFWIEKNHQGNLLHVY